MSTPIAFGHRLVISSKDDTITRSEEYYSNFNTVKEFATYTESVKVNSDKQALAEFLNLLDRYRAGEITKPGIQIIEDDKGNLTRVEKSWTIEVLR